MIALFTAETLEAFATGLLSFSATWFVQATLLLGLCALLARRVSRGSAKVEEGLWKIAIVASLVMTLLVLSTGWKPLGGRLALPLSRSVVPATLGENLAVQPSPVADVNAGSTLPTTLRTATLRPDAALGAPTLQVTDASTEHSALWRRWTVWVLAAGALLGLLRLVIDQRAFAKRISHRRPLRAEEAGRPGRLAQLHHELLEESGLSGRVALSASARLQSPIAFGLRKREICVPVRAIGDLEPEEQRAMLAHEVAHAARRDPAWMTSLRLLRAVFWFQPLLLVAERRLHVLFELRCDRSAARLVDDPLALASCLTEVAAWIVPPVPRTFAAAGMAASGSFLGVRVDELLSLSEEDLRGQETPTWRNASFCISALLLFAFASASPAIGSEEPQASLSPSAPEIAEAIEPRVTPIAPHPSLALLAELDAELQALNLEFGELRQLAASSTNPSVHAMVNDWGTRLQSLKIARLRLEAALASSPHDHGSQTAPDSNPEARRTAR